MKSVSLLLVACTFMVLTSSKAPDQPPISESVAVVELFTSQGCSSCPSADAVLSRIVEEAERKGKPIFGLSFHVSYWNRLGWTDPFSKSTFTDRQRKYGAVLNSRSIYTPQMVVNGKYEFVGSSRSSAETAINKALDKASSIQIAISDLQIDDKSVRLNYRLSGDIQNTFLNIAVVERDLKNYVPRGENRGLTLSHDNVVRKFKTIYPKQDGAVEVSIDKKSLDLSKSSIIVYAQSSKNLEVYGASRISIKG